MKSNWKYAVFSVKKSKTFKSMRFFLIFCFFCIPGVMANGYSQEQIVSLNLKQCDVNKMCIRDSISTDQMLDTAWDLFRKYFNKAELGIKQEIIDQFGGYENL